MIIEDLRYLDNGSEVSAAIDLLPLGSGGLHI
jgi:hypothetical protein